MIFLYHVENGTMVTLDMSCALENVGKLQEKVEKELGIPIAQQVLLISGGQSLEPDVRVCTYAAGTDTNPIFLFAKRAPGSSEYLTLQVPQDDDLEKVVNDHLKLPPIYSTVAKRASLASKLDDIAKENMRLCEECVHQQHLQQQGWAAVSANLEDSISSLRVVAWETEQVINEYLAKRETYLDFMDRFYDDLNILERIPILPALVKSKKPIEAYKECLAGLVEEVPVESEGEGFKEVSLLDWLTEENKNSPMGDVYAFCRQSIKRFDEELLRNLLKEVNDIMAFLNTSDMKEVKGLSDRLSRLEQIMRDYRKVVQEQTNLSLSFQMNSTRANSINDPSILPDLCDTHSKQLKVMHENHKQCINMKMKIFTAKTELCLTLVKRLEWVGNIENSVAEMTSKLVFYKVKLNSINQQFNFLHQIHEAPTMYLTAISEVLRRRMFSQAFLVWASDLACHLLTIHNEEIAQRKDFSSAFEDHFISNLFSGMEDMPSAFATEPPKIFDTNLPEIMQEDVDHLLQQLPEFSKYLKVPDTSEIFNFFTTRSIDRAINRGDDNKPVEMKLEEVVREAGLESNLDGHILQAAEPFYVATHGLPHLKDLDRGCESETDTEEFEKVGQSPLDLHFDKDLPSSRPGKQDSSTLTEDNLQSSEELRKKLTLTIAKLVGLSQQGLSDLRQELNTLRTLFCDKAADLIQQHSSVEASLEQRIIEYNDKNSDRVKNFASEYQTICERYKVQLQELTGQVEQLAEKKSSLEISLSASSDENKELHKKIIDLTVETQQEMNSLRNKIVDLEKEKEAQIKETVERLNAYHKTELENAITRFKLMTTVQSPSDKNLEKSEKSSKNKKTAVGDAAASMEAEKWQNIMKKKIEELTQKFEEEKKIIIQDVAKEISEDKDKQIDILRERESNLILECRKHKYTIQQLAESQFENDSVALIQKVEQLEHEKGLLQVEIEQLKRERLDMGSSVTLCEGKIDTATSPVKQRKHKDTSVQSSGTTAAKPALLNVDSCKIGDLVFIFWDKDHETFKILQNERCLYFLHLDYLEPLGIQIVDKQPNKCHATGEVIEKEYCLARKSKNRYNLPKGTKFFRVKVKPATLLPVREVIRSYHQTSSAQPGNLWQSQTVVPTGSSCSATDAGPSRSLPSSPPRTQGILLEDLAESRMEDSSQQTSPVDQDKQCGGETLDIAKNESDHEKACNFLIDILEGNPSAALEEDTCDGVNVDRSKCQGNNREDCDSEEIRDPQLQAGDEVETLTVDAASSPSSTQPALLVEPGESDGAAAGPDTSSSRFIDSGVDADLDKDIER